MKKSFMIIISLFMAAFLFSEDWYVCMGSFKNQEKALDWEKTLNQSGFSAFISEYKKSEDETLYRVLFSEKFDSKEKSIFRRDELLKLSKISELSLNDLWCCQSDGIKFETPAATAENVTEAPVAETENTVEPEETEQTESAEKTPEKQTVIVKVNNIEEQRFDITTEDRVIRVNVNVPGIAQENQSEEAFESDDK